MFSSSAFESLPQAAGETGLPSYLMDGDTAGKVPYCLHSLLPPAAENLIAVVNGQVLAEYIWLGGSGTDMRGKTKVLDSKPGCVEELPVIVVDGSSCGQAVVDDYEVYLRPRKIFPDPFRGGDHILVLCETLTPPPVVAEPSQKDFVQPHPTNNRAPCETVMSRAEAQQPVFSIEQEYTLLDPTKSWPLGWPSGSIPEPGRPYFGGVGHGVAMGREIAEAHARACLKAGVTISGMCATATPGLWSYQVGPCVGVDMGDQLWASRYILLRVSERHKVLASFDPKPIPGDWSGSGCFVKFSTHATREPGTGLNAIQVHLQTLHSNHLQYMTACGQGNTRRFFGSLGKPAQDLKFTCGFGNKNCSITVPRSTLLNRGGYYIDRRPASNMDPYLVTMLLVSTTLQIALPSGSAPIHLSQGKMGRKPSCSAFSASQTCTYSAGSSLGAANTEDVLIDELEKLDQVFAPDTPPNFSPSLSQFPESSDECSDGTSPENRSPLALAMAESMYI